MLEHQQPHEPFSLKFPTPIIQSAYKTPSSDVTSQSVPVGRTTHLIFDSQPINRRRVRSKTEQPFSAEDSDNESSSSDDSTTSGTLGIETLTGFVKKMSLGANENIPIHQNDDTLHQNNRFHGNCSPVDLIEAVRQLKSMHSMEMTQSSLPQEPDTSRIGPLALRLDFWRTPHVSSSSDRGGFINDVGSGNMPGKSMVSKQQTSFHQLLQDFPQQISRKS